MLKYIIYDTSAIIKAQYIASDAELIDILLKNSSSLELKFIIPKIVLDESKNKINEEVNEANKEYKKILKSIQKFQRFSKFTCDDEIIKNRDLKKIEAKLETAINNLGDIIPYPEINHEDVVKRALKRRKPFDDKGHNGYRDTILWESILSFIAKNQGEVIFLSENYKDFYDEKEWKKQDSQSHRLNLNKFLIEDLKINNFPIDNFKCYTSLSSFYSNELKDQLKDIENITNDIYKPEFIKKLKDFLTPNILLKNIENFLPALYDDYDYNYIGISEIEKVLSIKRASKNNAIIELDCCIDFDIDVYIYKSDYALIAEEVGKVEDWNDHYFMHNIFDYQVRTMLIVYDLNKEKILGVSSAD